LKKILIADDDSVARGMLTRVLMPSSDKFEVMTAKSEEEALTILSRHKINLLITDFHISGTDGFNFLSFIRRNYKEIPVFVTTAFGTPEVKDTVESIEKCRYFEKPLNVKALKESIFKELDSIFEDQARRISLPSFLRQIAKEIKTCTLVIKSGDKKGELFFLNGDLISAKTDDLKNKEAAYEIISWKKSNIEIHNAVPQTTRVIDEPLVDVLMEGLRRREKKKRNRKRKKEHFREIDKAGVLTKNDAPGKSDKPNENGDQSYSEHYSRTKNFINKIDEIQISAFKDTTKKSKTGTEEESFDKSNPAIDSERLMISGSMAKVLQELQFTLAKVIGPIAKIIFMDSLKEWIATDHPDLSTIPNLVDIVCREINDPEKFNIYRKKITPHVRMGS